MKIGDKTIPLEDACLAGIRCYQEKRVDDAIDILSRVIRLDPCHPRALNALAVIACERGDYDSSINYLNTLLTAHPGFEKGYNTLGNVFVKQGKMDEAIDCFCKAIGLNPAFAEAYGNLGDLHLKFGRWDDASACYRRILDLHPDSFMALYSEGKVLSKKREFEEAIKLFRNVLAIKPGFAEAYAALGEALQKLGRLQEAVTSYEAGLELEPDSMPLLCLIGNVLLAQGFVDKAIEKYQHAITFDPSDGICHSNLLLAMHYLDTYSPLDILAESRRWDHRHSGGRVTSRTPTAFPPVRIGYVSADFRDHAVPYFFTPLLAAHDRNRFRIHCYADVAAPDRVTRQLEGLADDWVNTIGMTDKDLAERIAADRIDILVDLAGHTGHNRLRLFSMKPAPVQATWLGYPGTTGLGAMDYRISDSIADPERVTDSHHSETVIRLKDGFLCYAPPSDTPPVSTLPALGAEGVTFGSFNNLAKITPAVLATWGKLLRRLPHSRLILKNKWFSDEETRERCLRVLEAEGVDRSRILLLPHATTTWQHLAHYRDVDIALDTFPYNGTTTTFEALWMGAPVVTLAGDRHAARVGASILSRIDMEDLVAHTLEEYVSITETLAHNLARLNRFRQTLRELLSSSVLCDATNFARNMESAYLTMLKGPLR